MKRSGLSLPDDQKNKVEEMQNEIAALERKASQNINEDDTKIECSIEELAGLDEGFINRLEKVEGKENTHRYVSLKYPEIFPALRLVKSGDVRQRLTIAKESQCQDINTELLEDLLVKRQQIAEMLGYKSYSKFVLEERMAKSSECLEL